VDRPYANLVNQRPLPPNVDSLNIPRVVTGSSTAAQADAGAVGSVDPTTGSITAPVKIIAGQVTTSRQLVDRSSPALDATIGADLASDYASKVDAQLISGSGAGANSSILVKNLELARISSPYTS
jgi:HK97 family phage major capsid protein